LASNHSFGLGRGKVFPAEHAQSLLSPLRRLLDAPRDVVHRMRLAAGDRVLEVGSGPGYFSPELARAVPGGSLVLFDLQAPMLSLARQRLEHAPNVEYAQGDAARLPFADRSFDAALLVYVLGEVPDRDACARELSRILRPGGSATFVETWRDSDFVRFARLDKLLGRHGFTLAERRGWLGYTARFQLSAAP
jgi:ubiquinone/menaquinone biosynthesis C-methylase UbiE